MKKKVMILIVLLIVAAFCLVGCANNSAETVINPPGSNTNIPEPPIADGSGSVNPITAINRYVPEQVYGGLQYDYSISLNDQYDIYYFYIGAISETPIMTSVAKRYNYDGQEMDFRVSKTTKEEIINKSSRSINTINTHSYTGGFDIGFKRNVTLGASSKFLNVAVEFETSLTNSHHWTNNSGTEITRSDEKAEAYSEEYTEEHTIKYVLYEKNGYKIGRSYRETLFEVVDMFAIVTHDKFDNKFTYEYKPYITGEPNLTFVTEESDEFGSFSKSSTDKNLHFDLNAAMDIIMNKIDSTDVQVWSDEFSKAHALGFDGGKGTETSPFIISGKTKPALEQFLLINNHLNEHFILKTNIDLSLYKPKNGLYNAIIKNKIEKLDTGENVSVAFTGSLNGNNHKIHGLDMNLHFQNITPNESYGDAMYKIGIFEEMNGKVKNLIIDDAKINFKSYHDKKTQLYYVGILTANGSGNIENVTVQNSDLHIHRAQSRIGFISGAFKGKISNCKVLSSFLFCNGDGGGIVGENSGIIELCEVVKSKLEYHAVRHDKVNYETSMGGICGTLVNNATVKLSKVTNTSFGVIDNDKMYSKIGYVIGHAMSGRVHNIAQDKCTVKKNRDGKYYFKVGFGWAGKYESKYVDVI